MMRYRALGTPRESCCCLPTPYRIPKAVAGMAFNFSLVEIAPKPPSAAKTDPGQAAELWAGPLLGFALPRFAHAT